jgi:hypothetical protein
MGNLCLGRQYLRVCGKGLFGVLRLGLFWLCFIIGLSFVGQAISLILGKKGPATQFVAGDGDSERGRKSPGQTLAISWW